MSIFSKRAQPDFVLDYLERTRKPPLQKTPFDAIRFVALDTETSGFRLNTDRLLSIAIFDIVNGQIDVGTDTSWILFQPGAKTNVATEIHGLLPSEIEQGQPENEVLRALLPLLAGAVVVGHNIRFDALMLDEAFRRNFGIRFCNRTIDVGVMAMNELIPFHRVGYANQHAPTIEDICAHLALPMDDRHTAEGDAFIAAEIFLLLSGRMRRRLNRSLLFRDFPIKK